ncbi:MAG: adenylate/guanylate cyclase domain-containing protein [Spirochaetes bacterium]|nr:adenylate/guanylate cyclase domain-containing protein [Spirochaetota bacterium]
MNGILDIRNVDLVNGQIINLEGDWEFYPAEFIDSARLLEEHQANQFQKIPKTWQEEIGYATYHLKILLKPTQKLKALKINRISSSARIYANGQLIFELGRLGTDKKSSTPQSRLAIVPVHQANADELSITIQVANFHDGAGGIINPLCFGTLENIIKDRQSKLLFQFFLFGSLLILGLYHFFLYYFRKSDINLMILGILCFVFSLRMLIYNESIIYEIMPIIDFSLGAKLGYLTFTFGLILINFFLYFIYPDIYHKKVLYVFISVSLFYSLLIIVTPPLIFSSILLYYQLFSLICGLYLLYVIFSSAIKKKSNSLLMLLAFVIVLVSSFNDIVNSMLKLAVIELTPFGILSFVFIQAVVLSRRFNLALTKSEKITAKLEDINISIKRFVPQEFLSFLKRENIQHVKLGDHSEQFMTIMFADIRGFSHLSETMTPEENFRFLNSYLSRMGPIIRKNRGFIDKYLGDGIMALFPQSADDGVQAAKEMIEELTVYNKNRQTMGYQPIDIGIGLHSGQLMMGTIGEEERIDGTVISNAVNLASRLKEQTKMHNKSIILSERTLQSLKNKDQYQLNNLGSCKLKGKSEAINIYALN